jgi:hypothetical protein
MIGDRPELPENVRPLPPGRARAVTVRKRTPGKGRQRRYRYLRQHTPHYYLVLTGITLALLVCGLNCWAFVTKGLLISEVAFGAVVVATLVIFTAFFWGFFMVMSGNIPAHRIRYFLPHGAVGVLSPLFYTLNISFDLEDLGVRPINGLSLVCSFLCLGLLGLQFAMGKRVVRPEPIRLLKPDE